MQLSMEVCEEIDDEEPPVLPLTCAKRESWHFSQNSERNQGDSVLFHPRGSAGTSALRVEQALCNDSKYYWSIRVCARFYGTSIALGICNDRARLSCSDYVNLIGEDGNGFALSHTGCLIHNGKSVQFTKAFRPGIAVTVGILFDGPAGTITFYKDGECLGVGFTGISASTGPWYPVVSSSTICTRMELLSCYRSFSSLKEICRESIKTSLKGKGPQQLQLPPALLDYINSAPSTA